MRKTEISSLEISTEIGNLAGNLEILRLFRNLVRSVAKWRTPCFRRKKHLDAEIVHAVSRTESAHVPPLMNGASCISRMIVVENVKSGVVSVEYISTHTGHKPSVKECKYLPLPPCLWKGNTRQVFQFSAGIAIERIMDGEWL